MRVNIVVRLTLFVIQFAVLSSPALSADAIQTDAPVQVFPQFHSYGLNIGGSAYRSMAGIEYRADRQDDSVYARKSVAEVKGTQEPTVYLSYREGELSYAINLPTTSEELTYALTLYFIEPEFTQSGKRVFDVIVEDEVRISNMDIISARDGEPKLALTRTITNLKVTDGVMNIALSAKIGNPVLSGIFVRSVEPSTACGQPKWQEDFTAESLNEDYWNYDLWPASKVNQELQRYTRDSKNVRLENGLLVLEAHYEPQELGQFSSARVHTANKVDLQYGRIEVRAKLPKGKGVWPAIWMLPTNPFKHATTCEEGADWQGSSECNAWPNSGEIDIMEHVGFDPSRVHATVHTEAFFWKKGNQRKASVELPDANDTFHTYAVDWTPNRLEFSVDGVNYFTYFKTTADWRSWPFDAPFHLILNLAVGGGWGGAAGPPDLSAFPSQYVVDSVKMYDLEACQFN
jgi:beta-glucanase (GH16 family)